MHSRERGGHDAHTEHTAEGITSIGSTGGGGGRGGSGGGRGGDGDGGDGGDGDGGVGGEGGRGGLGGGGEGGEQLKMVTPAVITPVLELQTGEGDATSSGRLHSAPALPDTSSTVRDDMPALLAQACGTAPLRPYPSVKDWRLWSADLTAVEGQITEEERCGRWIVGLGRLRVVVLRVFWGGYWS